MGFIRVKKIKEKPYAYLVENTWKKRKKGSRQKVSKYLGKVVSLPASDSVSFFDFIQSDASTYASSTRLTMVDDLIRYELSRREFQSDAGKLSGHGLTFDIGRHKFVTPSAEEAKIVVEMNEGFLSAYTINQLLRFKKHSDDEREDGIRLAKLFLEAGLQVPQEIFVSFFEKS